jgi:glutathione S-transferase
MAPWTASRKIRAMAELILHHYDVSPFARKVRSVLGYKQLAWRSCDVAMLPPRPQLTALTGGYRRIPVLQVGADLICDSNAIVRYLDELRPDPALYAEDDVLSVPVSQWFEPRMFTHFSALAFRKPSDAAGVFESDEARIAFGRDRAGFMAPMMDIRKNADNAATCAAHVRRVADFLEQRLGDGRPYLQGAAPTHADFSAFHPFHWLQSRSAKQDFLADFTRLWVWVDRIIALGEGARTPIKSEEALAIARSAEPTLAPRHDPGPGDPARGANVRVAPNDYGVEPVEGELLSVGLDHVSIKRATEAAGMVAVHFPRWGYRVDAV